MFSGDSRAAREGLAAFHERHKKDSWVVQDNGVYEIRIANQSEYLFEKERRRAISAFFAHDNQLFYPFVFARRNYGHQ